MGVSTARTRKSPQTLAYALAGCWVSSIIAATSYVAAVSSGDDAYGVLILLALPIGLPSILMYVLDAGRNPKLGQWAVWGWVLWILYLPFAGSTAYWLRYGRESAEGREEVRSQPRVSQRMQDKALTAWMVWVLVVGSGFVVYVLLGVAGVAGA